MYGNGLVYEFWKLELNPTLKLGVNSIQMGTGSSAHSKSSIPNKPSTNEADFYFY